MSKLLKIAEFVGKGIESLTARQRTIPKSAIHFQSEHGYFPVDRRTNLYFEDTGGDGPVFFFLYGLGCSIAHWKYQMKWLQENTSYRIVWVDYRWHGLSSSKPEKAPPLTLARIVKDIALFCESRELEKVSFLGQSMGGTVALMLAAKYPHLVQRLVVMGAPTAPPSQTMDLGMSVLAGWTGLRTVNRSHPHLVQNLYQYAPLIKPAVIQSVRFKGFNPTLTKLEDIEEYVDVLLATNPSVFWDLAEDLENINLRGTLRRVGSPTLIIAGLKDNLVPLEVVEKLDNDLPNSRLWLLEHGTHCPHFDDPTRVSEEILQFVSET